MRVHRCVLQYKLEYWSYAGVERNMARERGVDIKRRIYCRKERKEKKSRDG